jgi:diguanylate cyclase (GGDEF)-like protein/PAS domain S-box-containing protein
MSGYLVSGLRFDKIETKQMDPIVTTNPPGRLTAEDLSHYYVSPFYEALMVNSPIAIVILDIHGNIENCNPAFNQLFGYSREEILGESLDRLITNQETYQKAVEYTYRCIALGNTIRAVAVRYGKGGTPVNVEIQGVPVFRNGTQTGVLALYHDITHLKQVEDTLRSTYTSLVHIMNSIDADVYVADLHNYQIKFMNQHIIASFGDQVGKTCYEKFRGRASPCEHCTNPLLLDKDGKPTAGVTWEGYNPISKRWYKNSDRAIIWSDGRPVRMQIAVDITEIKESENKLQHLATHDPLTQLPNRMYFQARLEHALANANRSKTFLAVMFLDLDHFKDINDQLGHHAGDNLLKQVAQRIISCVRDNDTVARVSGDEFCIILENIPNVADSTQVAERIIRNFTQPYIFENQAIHISASLGISVYPDHGTEGEELLKLADAAMYQVKKLGGNQYLVWTETITGFTGTAQPGAKKPEMNG